MCEKEGTEPVRLPEGGQRPHRRCTLTSVVGKGQGRKGIAGRVKELVSVADRVAC